MHSSPSSSLLGSNSPQHLYSAPVERARRASVFLGVLGAILLGVFIGYYGRTVNQVAPGSGASGRGVLLKSGPWGEMEYVPIAISAPVELLPIRSLEEGGTSWFFSGETRDSLPHTLDALGLSRAERDDMVAESHLRITGSGAEVRPSAEIAFSIDAGARLALYRRLALDQENGAQLAYVPVVGIEDRLERAQLSERTVENFYKLTCRSGRYLVLSALPTLLGTIGDYNEKVRLMKALTEQKSCLLRLHVTPESDLEALRRYWGKGAYRSDVKELLASLAGVHGGTWVDVIELLPPFPSSLLYTFPHADNPLAGPPVRRDCHWTAFNFFRDPPDPRYTEAAYVFERLKLNYFALNGDPRYGDLVTFSLPSGSIIHSALFIADDVVYTKNGDTPVHPWMLSTIEDLLEQYSFMVKPSEKLTVSYFRNKYN